VPVMVLGPPTAGRYTVELAPLFTVGLLAAGVVHAGDRIRSLPWYGLSALAAAPILTLIAIRGPEWAVSHYFWLDLAAGPAIAMFLAAVATRRPGRLLNHGPLPFLGGFSYSLYLIHMPIVALTHTLTTGSGPAAFGFTMAVALPLCLLSARLLATFCEAPFLVRRPPTRPPVLASTRCSAAPLYPERRRGSPPVW
jgi:peptidoglycan/LPS O-acetylase OafA/YrhL